MRDFVKFRIWDIIVCVAISTGLVFHLYSGFYLEDALSSSVLYTVALLAALAVAMALFSISRVMTGIGSAVGIALLVAFIVYMRGHSVGVGMDEASETANSLFISLSVVLVAGALVYLASRSRAGTIAIFLGGNVLVCGSHFLHFPSEPWQFLLFEGACVAMLWQRNYMAGLKGAQAGRIRLPRYMVQTVLAVALSLVIGCGAWYGVIRPLEPPTRELKLIQRMLNWEVLESLGLFTYIEMPDPDLTDSEEPEDREEGNDETEETEKNNEADEMEQEDPESEIPQEQKEQEETEAIYYLPDLYVAIPWLAICVCAAIVLFLVYAFLARRRWKKRLDALTPEAQAVNYYLYWYRILRRAGYKKPDSYTLYEYADDMEHTLQEFGGGDAAFGNLTAIYVRTFYGHNPVTGQELSWFRTFHAGFAKALRRETGFFRYVFRFLWV